MLSNDLKKTIRATIFEYRKKILTADETISEIERITYLGFSRCEFKEYCLNLACDEFCDLKMKEYKKIG